MADLLPTAHPRGKGGVTGTYDTPLWGWGWEQGRGGTGVFSPMWACSLSELQGLQHHLAGGGSGRAVHPPGTAVKVPTPKDQGRAKSSSKLAAKSGSHSCGSLGSGPCHLSLLCPFNSLTSPHRAFFSEATCPLNLGTFAHSTFSLEKLQPLPGTP